jgi:integration host factor subunit alpha
MINVTRDDIAEFINYQFGLTKKDCSDFVNDLIENIIIGLQKEKFVKIHNFGTFRLKQKGERIGRNPKTKEKVMIPSRNVITFIPSKKILTNLNKKINGREKI